MYVLQGSKKALKCEYEVNIQKSNGELLPLMIQKGVKNLDELEKLENVAKHNIMYLKKAMRNLLVSENDKVNFDCIFEEELNMPSLISLRCKFLIVRGLLKISGFGKEWHLQNEFGFELDDMYNT